MGKYYDSIPDSHVAWINKQHMFFVATAPRSDSGHVNVSPKGLAGTFHVVNSTRVWYEDLSGTGIETIAHLRENGRITVMFCAFDGAPRILRLFGRGTVHEFGTPEYDALVPAQTRRPGSRAAIVVDVYQVSTTCGFAVPLYTYKADRTALDKWAEKLEQRDTAFAPHAAEGREEAEADDGVVAVPTEAGAWVYPNNSMKWWWAVENQRSLDGLPGLRSALFSAAALETGVGVMPPPAASAGTAVATVEKKDSMPNGRAHGGLLPRSSAEAARLVCVFVLGLVVAGVYGQYARLVADKLGAYGFV